LVEVVEEIIILTLQVLDSQEDLVEDLTRKGVVDLELIPLHHLLSFLQLYNLYILIH
tara:strand:- start:306 stop:476 length:171 start_codon:yes stop_codon:yes gene_type:complete